MNDAFLIRNYRIETDLPALTELVSALQGAALAPEQVLAMISWPRHDLARDRFVAECGGRLVGMSMLFPQNGGRCFVNASVHPDFRARGIGRALLERVIAEARERGARQVVGGIEVSNQAAQTFARSLGFVPAGEERYFTASADLSLGEPQLPAGFRLHSVAELGDTQIFADACNRCYADMWGHSENMEPVTVEKIEDWRSRHPNILRPAGMFVILAPDGSPVGVTRADRGEEGEHENRSVEYRIIDAPGVAPEYRALGLQRALVQAAAGWLKDNGSGRYQIETWGDSDEAVHIYESLGFALDEASHAIEFVRYLD